jgi:hypothetical protein
MEGCRIAATQLDARHLDLDHNLDAHLRLLGETAEADCDLVLFTELSVTGHNGSPRSPSSPSATTARSSTQSGTRYNTCALVGPDGLIGLQRKVHASFDEFYLFRQASEWSVYDLGFAVVGTAICHDSDFFENWRILALKASRGHPPAARQPDDARPRRHPHFDGSGREAPEAELLQAQHELLESHPEPPRLHDVLARDNGVNATFSDQVGFDGHSTHVGGAYGLDPDGAMIARSGCGIPGPPVGPPDGSPRGTRPSRARRTRA